MANVLITGVAGLTGAHLARKCLACGDTVTGVDNYFRGTERNIQELFSHKNFIFYNEDFRTFIQYNRPDPFEEIYHLAAIVPTRYFYEAPELTYEVNCHGTYLLFRWALQGGARRFVNASSSEIYGHPQQTPIREDMPSSYDSVETTTRWSYAHGKILTEYLLNAHKEQIALCHLRYANVYGPYDVDPHHVIPYMLLCLWENKPITLSENANEVKRSFLYMSDCADATYLAMKKMTSGTSYNIGNPEEVSVRQLWELAKEIAEEEFSLAYGHQPSYTLKRAGDPQRRVLDIQRAKSQLGYTPRVSLREGLQKTARWMKNNLLSF